MMDEMSAQQQKPELHIEKKDDSRYISYRLDGKPVPITSYHPWVFIEDGSILEGVHAWNFDQTSLYAVYDMVSVRVKPEKVSIEELAGYTKEQWEALPGVRLITVLHAVPGAGVVCLLRPDYALVVAGEHEALFATIRERNEYLSIPLPDLSGGSPKEKVPFSTGRGRTGERVKASLPDSMRLPTARTAHDTMTAFFAPNTWRPNETGTAIFAQRNETQVMLDCDDAIGFGPERAIQQIAQHGPATAQTFLALAGLWLRDNKGRSHETYMTVGASDLLRFQGRKPSSNHGFDIDEIMAKGRDVWVLSRISVPKAEAVTYKSGKQVRSLSIGPLFMVQAFDVQQTLEPGEVKSVVRFRYHMGRELFDWLCGEKPQFAEVSGKLLAYHPTRQKLQILLGFSLAYYDRVNDKQRRTEHKITLPALLNMAGLEIDKTNPKRFLEQVEDALRELGSDGVIPGIALQKPGGWAALLAERKAREVLRLSSVAFPRLSMIAPKVDRAPA